MTWGREKRKELVRERGNVGNLQKIVSRFGKLSNRPILRHLARVLFIYTSSVSVALFTTDDAVTKKTSRVCVGVEREKVCICLIFLRNRARNK